MVRLPRYILALTATTFLTISGTACAKDELTLPTQSSVDVENETSGQENIIKMADAQSSDTHSNQDHSQHDHSGHDHSADVRPVDPNLDYIYDFGPEEFLIGSATAPNEMIIYASVTCPHCASWFQSNWTELKTNYVDTGQLRIAFREIVTPPEDVALFGFVTASCAPDDKYFDHIYYQMENQKTIMEQIFGGQVEIAADTLLNLADLTTEDAINACLSDPSHIDRINLSGDCLLYTSPSPRDA